MKNSEGKDAISLALDLGYEDIVDCLFFHSNSFDAATIVDRLYRSIRRDSFSTIERLLRSGKYDLNYKQTGTGITAVATAAMYGRVEILNLLLSAGANVDALDARGWAPLHFAVNEVSENILALPF